MSIVFVVTIGNRCWCWGGCDGGHEQSKCDLYNCVIQLLTLITLILLKYVITKKNYNYHELHFDI